MHEEDMPEPLRLLLLEIGGRVRGLRRSRKESQEVFSKRVGIDRSYLSQIETGKANLSIGVALRLSQKLHTNLKYLITGVQERRLEEEV